MVATVRILQESTSEANEELMKLMKLFWSIDDQSVEVNRTTMTVSDIFWRRTGGMQMDDTKCDYLSEGILVNLERLDKWQRSDSINLNGDSKGSHNRRCSMDI